MEPVYHYGRWARTRATLTIGQDPASNHWRRHTSSTIDISESDLIEIKISFWSRGLYNQLVSRRGSGDFRVIWHNLQPLMGTFTFLEGKGKVKLKLVNIQHPTAKQSTSPQKRSCFQFQILFYNKTAIFHFSENTSKRLGCKNGILRLRE